MAILVFQNILLLLLLSFTDQSVDMLDWFSKMTLEVILATAFGVDAKIQMGENSEILQEAKKLFHVPFFLRQMARFPSGNQILRLLLVLNGHVMEVM